VNNSLLPPIPLSTRVHAAGTSGTGAAVEAAAHAADFELQELNNLKVIDFLKNTTPEKVEVPNHRLVTDPEYLRLIGDGSPIKYGVSIGFNNPSLALTIASS
jgi:hypothetical protein